MNRTSQHNDGALVLEVTRVEDDLLAALGDQQLCPARLQNATS